MLGSGRRRRLLRGCAALALTCGAIACEQEPDVVVRVKAAPASSNAGTMAIDDDAPDAAMKPACTYPVGTSAILQFVNQDNCHFPVTDPIGRWLLDLTAQTQVPGESATPDKCVSANIRVYQDPDDPNMAILCKVYCDALRQQATADLKAFEDCKARMDPSAP